MTNEQFKNGQMSRQTVGRNLNMQKQNKLHKAERDNYK